MSGIAENTLIAFTAVWLAIIILILLIEKIKQIKKHKQTQ